MSERTSPQRTSTPESTGPLSPRPAVVTVGAALLLVGAAAIFVYSVPTLLFTERVLDIYQTAYGGTVAEQAVDQLSATSAHVYNMALLSVAAGLAAAAIAVPLRKNAGRVTAWVLGGLAVCTIGPALLLEPSPPPRPPGTMPQHEIDRLVSEVIPPWLTLAGWAALVIIVVGLLVAMVLLGLPRANDFFRKLPPTVPPPPPLHPR